MTFKSNFALWSSFQVKFERAVNGLGGQKSSQGSNLIWSNGIQCKNRRSFYWRVTGALFWVKNIKSAIWDIKYDYASLNRKGLQSLRAVKTKSRVKVVKSKETPCTPGSGNWRVELLEKYNEDSFDGCKGHTKKTANKGRKKSRKKWRIK